MTISESNQRQKRSRVGVVAAGAGPRVERHRENPAGEVAGILLTLVDEGFPPEDARLLARLFIDRVSVAELARAEGVDPQWVRAGRDRALLLLAEHIGFPLYPADT
jgi:hypothetical protein